MRDLTSLNTKIQKKIVVLLINLHIFLDLIISLLKS